MSFYDYSVTTPRGEEISMKDYAGKVVMVVNTQAPGTDEEIHEFCQLHYNTKFPQMKKSDVNGENAIPLFKYLKSQKGFEGFDKNPAGLLMSGLLKTIDKDYKKNPEIKWNFTKFIVDREGNVVARFEPTTDMKKVDEFVASLI